MVIINKNMENFKLLEYLVDVVTSIGYNVGDRYLVKLNSRYRNIPQLNLSLRYANVVGEFSSITFSGLVFDLEFIDGIGRDISVYKMIINCGGPAK